jgi:PAS domain-containing protein
MAPEQTGRMNRSIDSRSDLYSLGVTLYQMVTGSLPFTASGEGYRFAELACDLVEKHRFIAYSRGPTIPWEELPPGPSRSRLPEENRERRKAEESLRASEERWRKLFENLSAGIALISRDGRVFAANFAFQKMLGCIIVRVPFKQELA